MKKILPVITLCIGLLVGWCVASYFARRNLEKIQQGWSPEVRDILKQSAELARGMTTEELQATFKDLREYADRVVDEWDSKTFWQAIFARQIRCQLQDGNAEDVEALLQDRLVDFLEVYDEGGFEGNEWEDVAISMAAQLRKEGISPTNTSTVQ